MSKHSSKHANDKHPVREEQWKQNNVRDSSVYNSEYENTVALLLAVCSFISFSEYHNIRQFAKLRLTCKTFLLS
jgi:hypothetical protein